MHIRQEYCDSDWKVFFRSFMSFEQWVETVEKAARGCFSALVAVDDVEVVCVVVADEDAKQEKV